MALTQTDVDTLERALATGTMRVRFADGREVTYRSSTELLEAIRYTKDQVAKTGGTKPPVAGYAGFRRSSF